MTENDGDLSVHPLISRLIRVIRNGYVYEKTQRYTENESVLL